MIALVRGVMRASICPTSMFQVTGSQSTSTGVAPARTMRAAQEMMVKVGRMTSSPGPRPSAATAASSAARTVADRHAVLAADARGELLLELR